MKFFEKIESFVKRIDILSALFGAILGGLVTYYFINPLMLREQYSADLSAVDAEISENQQTIISSIISNAEQIKSTARINGVDDKRGNLEAVSAMQGLSINDYLQLKIAYRQLTNPPSSDSALLNKLDGLYYQYDLLNEKISAMKAVVIASLGFQGDIFQTYIPKIRQDIEVLSNCLAQYKNKDGLPQQVSCPSVSSSTPTRMPDNGF